jgi:hypothetical protein
MEKKQDIDIEKIKEKLSDASLNPEWNKSAVWAAIETKKTRVLPIWKFSAAAAILCMLSFGFWFTLSPNQEQSVATLPAKTADAIVEDSSIPEMAELPIENEKVIANSFKPLAVKSSITKPRAILNSPSTTETANPINVQEMQQEVELATISPKAVKKEVARAEVIQKVEVANIDKPKSLTGQKITLLIPKIETQERSGVLGFVQKIGKFNQTGVWEKEQKGRLWAKFVESTKTKAL